MCAEKTLRCVQWTCTYIYGFFSSNDTTLTCDYTCILKTLIVGLAHLLLSDETNPGTVYPRQVQEKYTSYHISASFQRQNC